MLCTDPVDLATRPLVAIWEVTKACHLACVHCRAGADPCADPFELGPGEVDDLVEQLRDLDPAVLVLTGGDPLMRADLLAIIEKASAAGLTVALAPSVTPLLTTAAMRRLRDAGVQRIALSLDGPDAPTHDGLRGVPGSFARTCDAIEAASAIGLPLQINTSLTRRTVGSIRETGYAVAGIAPALWSVFFVVPVGRASAPLQLDAAATEEVFHYLYDWRERTGLAAKTTAAPAFRRVTLERDATAARGGARRRPRPVAVNDGKGFVFVSHTGAVYPSGFLPFQVGHVRRERLDAVYRTAPLMQALRQESLLEGKCGACPFRTVCGGSRARAFATTGSLFAEDPACGYVPKTQRFAEDTTA